MTGVLCTVYNAQVYSSDVVNSPDFVPKLSNIERGQRLDGWPVDTLQ